MGFEAGKKWSYAIRFQHQSRPGVYLLWWLLFWIGTLFFFLEPTAAESCTHNFLISSHPTTRLAVQEKVSGEELMKLINKVARWFKWFNGLLLLLLLLPKGSMSVICSYLHLPQKSTNYLPTFTIKKQNGGTHGSSGLLLLYCLIYIFSTHSYSH